jgi:hypothetical protein
MRHRINKFGKITRKELENFLIENQVYGFVVSIADNELIYSYNIMFRNVIKDPEMLYVKVSKTSKLVLGSWTNRGKKFNNIDELKKFIKR